ncbi:MAG: hypothetical protein ACRDQD_15475 [Nocardioidaceae bacterium]
MRKVVAAEYVTRGGTALCDDDLQLTEPSEYGSRISCGLAAVTPMTRNANTFRLCDASRSSRNKMAILVSQRIGSTSQPSRFRRRRVLCIPYVPPGIDDGAVRFALDRKEHGALRAQVVWATALLVTFVGFAGSFP